MRDNILAIENQQAITNGNFVLSRKRGCIRWFSLIDKTVFWIYNIIYEVVMDTIKM